MTPTARRRLYLIVSAIVAALIAAGAGIATTVWANYGIDVGVPANWTGSGARS